jgi:hypothetical protein
MSEKFSELLTAMLRSLAGVVPPERLLGEYARRIEEKHEEIAALAQELGTDASHESRMKLVLEAKKRFPDLAGMELLRADGEKTVLAIGRRTFPISASAPAPAAPGVTVQELGNAPAEPPKGDDDAAARAQLLELD